VTDGRKKHLQMNKNLDDDFVDKPIFKLREIPIHSILIAGIPTFFALFLVLLALFLYVHWILKILMLLLIITFVIRFYNGLIKFVVFYENNFSVYYINGKIRQYDIAEVLRLEEQGAGLVMGIILPKNRTAI
jgi:glucan phosphoethanolaminetransferase (alkaline phosphatase superfamily)